jgi:hypothetical protein
MKNPPFAESGRKKRPAENVSRPFVPSADRTTPDAATAAVESGKHAMQIQFAIPRWRLEGRPLDDVCSPGIGPMKGNLAERIASSPFNVPFGFSRRVCDRY